MLPVHNSFGVQGFLACDRYVFTFARSGVMPIAVLQPPGVRRLMRKGPLSRAHSETVLAVRQSCFQGRADLKNRD
ncbi:hypothetical protein CEJ86_10535 [Sinorhizobium meliloti]|jgi:hypothetical protein|uniref:Uncharacterized protein n=1 Tax=Rhizobium meliloti TaxID=382 RepID=A0A2J0Z3P0_RHIML|nr:hypothetical protein CEJ86_10535 [Sinorhizobium meliloti]